MGLANVRSSRVPMEVQGNGGRMVPASVFWEGRCVGAGGGEGRLKGGGGERATGG